MRRPFIEQATKGGNFKGDQSLEHNCDFVIKVVNGIAYHKGRFGPESEIPIFEQSLYDKNHNKPPLKAMVTESPKRESTIELQNVPAIHIPTEIPPFTLFSDGKNTTEL